MTTPFDPFVFSVTRFSREFVHSFTASCDTLLRVGVAAMRLVKASCARKCDARLAYLHRGCRGFESLIAHLPGMQFLAQRRGDRHFPGFFMRG